MFYSVGFLFLVVVECVVYITGLSIFISVVFRRIVVMVSCCTYSKVVNITFSCLTDFTTRNSRNNLNTLAKPTIPPDGNPNNTTLTSVTAKSYLHIIKINSVCCVMLCCMLWCATLCVYPPDII